ncbi:hypothetical protein [Streptomyces sp. NPDC054849]
MHPPLGIPEQDTMELFLGDVGAPSTAQGPPAPAAAASPVFVDTSGRRQRRVRRWGYMLVVPAVAYVVLLISTVLGGPTIQSPFLPSAQAPHPPEPQSTAGTRTGGPSTPGAARSGSPRPTPAASRGGAPSPAAATVTGGATPGGPTTTTEPAHPAPSPPGGGRGRATEPPGQGGGKPTVRP